MDVSIVGLGKLGSVFAAVLASRGLRVYGCDKNPAVVESLNHHIPTHYEPGLEECLLQAGANLRATTSVSEVVGCTDITFVLVNTPSTPAGSFDAVYVEEVVREIALAARDKPWPHTIVISSTVAPGTCKKLKAMACELAGKEVRMCYCPEFIALGEAVKGFSDPSFIVVGTDDTGVVVDMAALFKRYTVRSPKVIPCDFDSAEVAKIALNFWLTSKITFANQLARVCHATDADVGRVLDVLGADPRISPAYMKAGGPYGGPCFPRDVEAFGCLEALVDGGSSVLGFGNAIVNREMVSWVFDLVLDGMEMLELDDDYGVLCVLGRAFKNGTDVVVESLGDTIMEMATEYGYKVIWYDPCIEGEYDCPQHAADDADVVLVANLNDEFKRIAPKRDSVVIDVWGQFERRYVEMQGAHLLQMGRRAR